MKRIALLVPAVFLFFCGCDDKKGAEGDVPDKKITALPPALRGFSFNYVPWGSKWRASIDMLATYKVNHFRVFAMGAPQWDVGGAYHPWLGGWNDDISNLDPVKVKEMTDLIDYANSKGMVPQLDLFVVQYSRPLEMWNEGGAAKEQVKSYAAQLTNQAKADGRLVIIGMGNEISGDGIDNFQSELFDEVVNNPKYVPTETYTSSYHTHARPWTYTSIHEMPEDRPENHGIISSDTPSLIYWGDDILCRVVRQADECPLERVYGVPQKCHVEYAGMWGREGREGFLDTPEKIIKEYGGTLKCIKALQDKGGNEPSERVADCSGSGCEGSGSDSGGTDGAAAGSRSESGGSEWSASGASGERVSASANGASGENAGASAPDSSGAARDRAVRSKPLREVVAAEESSDGRSAAPGSSSGDGATLAGGVAARFRADSMGALGQARQAHQKSLLATGESSSEAAAQESRDALADERMR